MAAQPKTTATKNNDKSTLWDLEEQFAFYGQYHANKYNVLIHIVCVPTIFWTTLVLFNKIAPWHVTIPLIYGPLKTDVILNWSFLTALGYALYFIGLEPIAGSEVLFRPPTLQLTIGLSTIYAPFLIFLGWSANEFYANNSNAMKLAGLGFIGAWICQFIGHGKFEGRAPALFDSLFQSLVLALFFVALEVFFSLGYRPALHKRLQNRIGKEVLAYRQQKKREGKPDPKSTEQQTVWRG